MPKVIEIPEYGEVEFPDTMSDMDINSAAKRLYQAKTGKMPDVPNPPATMGDRAKSYLSEAVGNIPKDIGEVAGNIYNLGKTAVGMANFAINPYRGTSLAPIPEAPKAIGNLALGTAESMIPFWSPDTPERRQAEAVGSEISTALRHPVDTALNRIKTKPVQSLMDVAALATGGGALMKEIPALAKAGKVVSKAGEFLDPVQNTMKMTGHLTRGVVEPSLRAMGRKQYQRALNPTGDLYENYWASKAGVEAGIPLSAKPQTLHGDIVEGHWKVIDRSKALKDAADVQIDAVVKDLTKQGYVVNRDQIADDALGYLKTKYASSDTARQDIEKLEKLAEEYKKEVVLDPKTGGYIANEMTPLQAQAQKVIVQHKAETAYKSGDIAAAESLRPNWQKAVAFEIRKKLEGWAPQLAGLNKTSRDYKLLTNELEKFVNQRLTRPKQTPTQWAWAGGRVAGTLGSGAVGFLAAGPGGGAAGVLAALALGSPPIRSRLAIMLNKAARAAEAGGTALVEAAPIVPITPATQILNRLMPMPAPPPSLSQRQP